MNGSNGNMTAGIGMMVLWFVFLIALIVGIVLFIIWLIRRGHKTNSSAADILKEKYAKGELNKAEFTEKMKDIS